MNQFTVTLKNDVGEIERLSEMVNALGLSQHLPEDFLYAVNLALDEILTNVISYGYLDEATHELAVHVAVHQGELIAEITDDARPFNPLEVGPADTTSPLAERQVGGLGIHLARKLMDSMTYRREQGKNILTIKKSIGS